MELGATETSVYNGIRTEEVGKCLLPSSVASILKLEAEHRTVNRNKMKEKDICLNLPVVLNPKKHQCALIFPQVFLELLLYCYFALSLITLSKRKLLIPSSECSLELTNVAFKHIKWKEVTEIFTDNADSLSISGYM